MSGSNETNESAGPSTADDDPLRLSECPECRYRLDGLPDAGTCPECGTAYDRDREIVLTGYAAGDMADVTNETDGEFVKRLLGSMVFPALFWLIYRNRVSWPGLLWLPLLAGPGLLLAVRAIVWANRSPAGTVRVRLSADAVRQDSLVRAAVVAGRRLTAGVIVALCVTVAWVGFAERASAGTSGATIVAVAAFIAAASLSRRRRGPPPGRPGWASRFGLRRPVLASPWADPDHVLFGEAKSGVYRLRCPGSPTFFRPTYVDAHVRLTPGEAAALRQRMGNWRRAAYGADALL